MTRETKRKVAATMGLALVSVIPMARRMEKPIVSVRRRIERVRR